jgi:hypothetical protein
MMLMWGIQRCFQGLIPIRRGFRFGKIFFARPHAGYAERWFGYLAQYLWAVAIAHNLACAVREGIAILYSPFSDFVV